MTNKNFVVKDSGKRMDYPSGMRRDTQDNKPNYNLIDLTFLRRIATHLVKGAEKYGRDNWRLANSMDERLRFQDSAFRHLMQYLNNEEDEDHMAAVCFNLMAAEYTKAKMEASENEESMQEYLERKQTPKRTQVEFFQDTTPAAQTGRVFSFDAVYNFIYSLQARIGDGARISFSIDADNSELIVNTERGVFKFAKRYKMLTMQDIVSVSVLVSEYVDTMRSAFDQHEEKLLTLHLLDEQFKQTHGGDNEDKTENPL